MKFFVEDVKSYVMVNLAEEDFDDDIILDKNSIGIFYLNSTEKTDEVFGFLKFGDGVNKLRDLNTINLGKGSNFTIRNDITWETRSENKTYNCRKLNSLSRFEFEI